MKKLKNNIMNIKYLTFLIYHKVKICKKNMSIEVDTNN